MSVACRVVPFHVYNEKIDGSPMDQPPPSYHHTPLEIYLPPLQTISLYFCSQPFWYVGKRFGLIDIGRMGSGKEYVVVGRKGGGVGFVVVTICENF